MARKPKVAEGQPADRRRSDLGYVGLSILLIVMGIALLIWGRGYFSADHAGFNMLLAGADILVTLGVALFLFRVLDQTDFPSLMKLGGTIAGGGTMFGLFYGLIYLAGVINPAPPAPAPPPPPPVAGQPPVVIHVPDIAATLQKGFHGDEMLLRLVSPLMNDLAKSKVQVGYVSYSDYQPLGKAEFIRGQVWPRPLTSDKSDDFYNQYAMEFCAMPTGADWSAVSQIDINCKFGGACATDPLVKAIKTCPTAQAAASPNPIATLLAPRAAAAILEAKPKPGWVVPDVEGACIAHDRLGETFYRFDVETAAPPKAVRFGYQLTVNGMPIYINGQRDPRATAAVADGKAKLPFALQNLEFSGAAGPIGGHEEIGLALQFYDAAGAEIGHKAGTYQFTALREPKPQDGDIAWKGGYVLGRAADGRELLLVSTGTPNADMRPYKKAFDGLRLRYVGTGHQLAGELRAVAVVRPFLSKADKKDPNARDGMPGLNVGFEMPDGRVRFTYTEEELAHIKAWWDVERTRHKETAGWQAAQPYGMRAIGTVNAAAAGCPKA